MEETEEGLKRRAYSLGQELIQSGLEQEVIYARFEKQNIPKSLAKKVIDDILIQKNEKEIEIEKPKIYFAFGGIILGIILAAVSLIFVPGKIILPIGLVAGGIIQSAISYSKIK